MKNSDTFRDFLNQMCQREADDTLHLPFNDLRQRLELSQSTAIDEIEKIQPYSEYSVQQIVFGCAHAVKFKNTMPALLSVLSHAKDVKKRHLLNNKDRNAVLARALERLTISCQLEPRVAIANSIINYAEAVKPLLRKKKCRLTETPVDIELHKFGCIHHPGNLLRFPKLPHVKTLLAFNLVYLFRHWPVAPETYPQYPPRPQENIRPEFDWDTCEIVNSRRGGIPVQSTGKPRYRLAAELVGAVFFDFDKEIKISEDEVKTSINNMCRSGVTFCNW